jgi:PAS domain S-box-containing protein
MKEISRLAFRMSPFLIFLILICSIFVSDVFTVLFIEIFPPLPRWGVSLLNAILPSVLILPIMYFFIFRPLTAHITERSQIEEALRESEDRFCIIAKEMSVIAEIGRVIGSSLEINEVYERFTAEARKLIPFDRITVNLCNAHENIATIAYVSGADLSNYQQGDTIPLIGTLVEELLRKRTGQIIQSEKMDEIVRRIPAFSRLFQKGLRSLIGIPLIYKDEAIGVLQFRSKTPDAYTEQDLLLAERIGAQIAGAIANAKLFSDGMRAEVMLRESEERYRNLFDNANEAIFVAQDGKLAFINPMTARMIGYSGEDLVSRSFVEFIHPDDRGMVIDRHVRRIKGEELPHIYSFRIIRGDDKVIWVELNTVVVNWEGKPATLNFLSDITERKRAEHQLRERVKELQAFFALSEITSREGITIEELYQEFSNILPKSWQYPEITCARIVIGGKEFRTGNFAESPWMQSAPIKVCGSVEGRIEVGYLEERPEEGEGPFLKEERMLINARAERLGDITERKQSEQSMSE